MLNKIVLVIEYDGGSYHGFQLQADLPTVQGEVEAALRKLTGKMSRVLAASRTDAGVHAMGQVISFRTGSPLPPQTFVSGLNYYLPENIAVRAAYRVEDSFDVRRDALSREYRYCIVNSPIRSPLKRDFAHLVAGHLDTIAMNEACRALIGQHDFASFLTGDGTGLRSTVRIVYRADVTSDGEVVVFTIEASSFLPHQVRNTVGSLIGIGLGWMSLGEFQELIAARAPGLAGPTVPARGLCLTRVNYPRPLGEMAEAVVSAGAAVT